MPQLDKPRALPPEGEDAPRSITQRPLDTCARPRSTPSTQETRHLQPGIASATSNTAATVEPASRKRCAEATTPDAGDATTVRRIGAPRPNHQVRGSSAGPYDGRRSQPDSEPRLPLPSTQGRRGQSCGSRTTGWRASWVGTDNDNLIIRNLPLFLSDAAQAWLEHLPPAQIFDWDDLVKAFAGNFQGTYVHPGNSWDLRSCRQQPGESLREYIRRFSKQCTELPNITDSDVIGAFLAGTTYRDLVSKLGRKTPTKASELMDIATKFASGQEAVEAIFRKDKQPQGRQEEDVPEASVQRGTKKKTRKKAQAKRNVVDVDLVAAAEHRNPWKPPGGANVFDKMLKESFPYHRGPVKHTLEECDMLRRYFNKAGPSTEGGKDQGNNKKGGNGEEEFPEVHNCFMIYDGQVANASARHRKQERREVCSVKVATPVYLDWSDKPITFDQDDHPDYVPNPGRYPLVVDPIIGNARLSKVLMDGGSSLNIIYAETLELLGVDRSTIRASAAPFHGIVPDKRVLPLGQLDLPVCFRTPSNFQKEILTFEVVEFRGTCHAVLGRPCYAKFMAVPNYTYLKLKMPGPKGTITVGSTYRHAYECDVECVEYAEAIAESEALIADLDCLSKEAPDAKRHVGNFEPAEAVKSVSLDPSNDASKKVRIGFELDPK
jgi:hypothetical protein